MRTRLFALCLCFAMAFPFLSAQDASKGSSAVSLANRRTALRCLEAAGNYASQSSWSAAASQAHMGLSYDDSVSDLWYIYAVSVQKGGGSKAQVLPLVQKALEVGNWVNYNRDNSRILYADILADTGRSSEALQVLDSTPPVFSSSAEYIRAKAYYRMGTPESYTAARNKISNARRIFPDDTRFPQLFFTYEIPYSEDATVRRLADSFISQIRLYDESTKEEDAELEIMAVSFARGDERKKLLQSFSARGLVHPLYAGVALEEGLMGQKEAFEYIASFADDSLNVDYMRSFLQMIDDEAVRAEAKEYFTAFCGELTSDTNGDGVDDMTVSYYRGRPQHIAFDANQDGELEWEVFCDFGLPVSGILYDADYLDAPEADFTWQTFPALSTFVIKDFKGRKVNIFNLLGEKLLWTPVSMDVDGVISRTCGTDFFFPVPNVDERRLDRTELAFASSSFTVPSTERDGAWITVTVLDAQMQSADYYHLGKLYAHTQFQDNLPVSRIIDADGDSVFETTEYYAPVSDADGAVHDGAVERTIMTNLFGTPSNGADFYLRMVQVDTNGDTVPDFTEEYMDAGSVVSSWDTDGDGYWNVRVATAYDPENGKRIETDMFYLSYSENVVSVTVEDGIPVLVKSGSQEYPVSKDSSYPFYWIGDAGSSKLSKDAVEFFKKNDAQGLSTIIERDGDRVHAVHVGEFCYGMLIPDVEM
ncbi:MAG: tetratricopeptide repeat protein [Treponema sp.]|nr:tetratricopeptide repeat protein [Treponema sp.]